MEGNYLTRNTHIEDRFSFEEHTWGISWPARNYGCSFCKREFIYAQALGGHMNVHRRDKARLRSSLSSWVSDQCPKPNPSIKPSNPTHLSPSSSQLHLSLSDEFLDCASHYGPCLTLSPSLSPASTSGEKKPRLASSQIPLLSPQIRETKMSNSKRSSLGVVELKGCALMEEEHKVFKNNENITLELGIDCLNTQKKS